MNNIGLEQGMFYLPITLLWEVFNEHPLLIPTPRAICCLCFWGSCIMCYYVLLDSKLVFISSFTYLVIPFFFFKKSYTYGPLLWICSALGCPFCWNCLLSTQTLHGSNQTKLCESIFDVKCECFYGDYFLISGHGQFKVFLRLSTFSSQWP